jgi:prepilin-type N-terminal cleavage/methylation domain-containing protein
MAARRETRGFTLVELMIVIAIIGLLITLLVPAVTKATAIIVTVKTKSILRDISLGLEAFRNDFGCYPPSYEEYDVNNNGVIGEDEKHYGATTLALYLRGPAARGWGTTAGGLMPFPGGRAQKAYGPYYEAEESRVVYFDDADNTVAGFTDAFEPVGLRDDVVVGRILYFRAFSVATTFAWTDNKDPDQYQSDPTKQAFMGYTSEKQSGKVSKTWKCPDPAHSELFENPGVCPIIGCEKTLVQRPGTKRYRLVSPGFDRRYGLLYERKEEDGGGIVPYTEETTETTLPLDDIEYER